jgi:hypothetical protein
MAKAASEEEAVIALAKAAKVARVAMEKMHENHPLYGRK